ncbi:FliA/WhiG family RNA polymerase sigma factor [Chitinispirillales bacterium ANBcel5]|uniref:FliA/WhiG family RNA polymerase sigma factor n=1 Tax=Cellulosispirillum alkaliphilum TaxID=3039283 RepID=UPI002A557B69|nr:FliA/WhiG family RNA polymerase sigma factor [Chitinispirillales bacterium ANBcel5]
MSNIDKLWCEFKQNGSKIAKDKLLLEYAHLVKYVTHRIALNLPPSVDRDDLTSAGIMGLIKAVETFDPERGFKFETYAGHKIRGAVLDQLRALDWVPRSVRQKSRDLQRVFTKLENELGRAPYDDEVCEELGIGIKEYEEMLSEVTPTTIISLEEAMPDGGSDSKEIRIIDTIEDPGSENPLKELGFTEVKNVLKEAISNLVEKEKLVIALYHYEELTLKEIGVVLDLTESRVSQIHSKAILKLRSKLLQKINA